MTEPTTAAGPCCSNCGRELHVMTDPFGNVPLDPEARYCHGDCLARQQDGSALLAIAEEHDNRARHGGCSDIAPKFRAALAALPPSAPPALDVERLRQLLLSDELLTSNRLVSDRIAQRLAEYARLQEQDR